MKAASGPSAGTARGDSAHSHHRASCTPGCYIFPNADSRARFIPGCDTRLDTHPRASCTVSKPQGLGWAALTGHSDGDGLAPCCADGVPDLTCIVASIIPPDPRQQQREVPWGHLHMAIEAEDSAITVPKQRPGAGWALAKEFEDPVLRHRGPAAHHRGPCQLPCTGKTKVTPPESQPQIRGSPWAD